MYNCYVLMLLWVVKKCNVFVCSTFMAEIKHIHTYTHIAAATEQMLSLFFVTNYFNNICISVTTQLREWSRCTRKFMTKKVDLGIVSTLAHLWYPKTFSYICRNIYVLEIYLPQWDRNALPYGIPCRSPVAEL